MFWYYPSQSLKLQTKCTKNNFFAFVLSETIQHFLKIQFRYSCGFIKEETNLHIIAHSASHYSPLDR